MDDRGRFRGPLKGRSIARLSAIAGTLLLGAAVSFGISTGRFAPALPYAQAARDYVAHVAGLGISSIVISGNQHVSREEVLAIAGITGTTSLLFLDAEQARGCEGMRGLQTPLFSSFTRASCRSAFASACLLRSGRRKAAFSSSLTTERCSSHM
jgi:hypothetical protein